jgi:hypothetical protein
MVEGQVWYERFPEVFLESYPWFPWYRKPSGLDNFPNPGSDRDIQSHDHTHSQQITDDTSLHNSSLRINGFQEIHQTETLPDMAPRQWLYNSSMDRREVSEELGSYDLDGRFDGLMECEEDHTA